MAQPSLFIGSSQEGIDFARAVRDSLKEDAEITLWKDGFFRPGITYIDSLISSLRRFDFAVLVLRPEDLVVSRNVENFGPRDNVIFELGLFMGWLGKERTIMLYQADTPIKLPSDLAGVAAATYRWPREDDDHLSAVGSACDEIRKIIRDLGFSDAKVSKELGIVRSHQQQQDLQISSQQAQIRNIVKFSMAWYIYDMLLELRKAELSGGEYIYRDNGSMDRNLRFLIDHGFVQEVYPWPRDGENLCPRVKITQPGIDVIAVRSAPD
jgi:hypothetical protein